MTAAEVLDADRARELCRSIRVDVEQVRERLLELYAGRAWESLGYNSWSQLCAEEFGTAVGALLPRSERRELVGQLTGDGLSTRAIGAALGVSDGTVRNDRGAQDYAPGPVTGTDGKTYPARPVTAARVETAVGEFPELGYYAAKGDDDQVLRLADSLRGYPPAEQEARRENLARFIDADRRGDLADSVRSESRVRQVMRALLSASSLLGTVGVDTLVAQLEEAPVAERNLWRTSLMRLTGEVAVLAEALSASPVLRSVR